MYLVIDTSRQNGTRLGRVKSKHHSNLPAALEARIWLQNKLTNKLNKDKPLSKKKRKGAMPVIWKGKGVRIGEMVNFFDTRLSLLTKAELKQIES